MYTGNCKLLICLDEYSEGDMSGKVYLPMEQEPKCFTNAVMLIKQISDALDDGEGPQSNMKVRGFFKKASDKNEKSNFLDPRIIAPAGINVHGRAATFRVCVLFRQNASWQGTVYWLEHGCEEKFRSVLELLMLIDSTFTDDGFSKKDLQRIKGAV